MTLLHDQNIKHYFLSIIKACLCDNFNYANLETLFALFCLQ